MIHSKFTEQEKAIAAGFVTVLGIEAGAVFSLEDPRKKYPLWDICKEEFVCFSSGSLVYRITTPDGLKGLLIIEFEPDDETLHHFYHQ